MERIILERMPTSVYYKQRNVYPRPEQTQCMLSVSLFEILETLNFGKNSNEQCNWPVI